MKKRDEVALESVEVATDKVLAIQRERAQFCGSGRGLGQHWR